MEGFGSVCFIVLVSFLGFFCLLRWHDLENPFDLLFYSVLWLYLYINWYVCLGVITVLCNVWYFGFT